MKLKAPRTITVGIRLSPGEQEAMRANIAAISAKLPPGVEISEAQHIRHLILEDARSRGITVREPAPVA